MRDWEEDFDFDFDFDNSIGFGERRTQGIRKDSYRTVQGDKTKHSDNDERRARIVAHIDRVKREQQELVISEGKFV